LRQLSSRYKIVSFEAVDNIMATDYLTELCSPLSEDRLDYQIFYEVKANLTRDQLRGLARAGVTTLQPGIESLSTHLLKLMRKGVTALRNVRMLKWAHYHGIRVGWNILTGFPGETEADYETQVALLPKLFHLPPPSGCGPVWLERFSPYFFDPSFPVRDVRPREAYRWIYPPGTVDLARTAYFFDYTMEDTVSDELPGRLRALVEQWKQRWEADPPPLLVYQRAPDWIQIIDRRDRVPRVHALSALEAAVYECCGDSDLTRDAITARLAESGTGDAGDALDAALERLCGDDLMLEDGGHYLSLALPVNLNW
jgi:ribosomal peptide maturation radical SAM protein 1